MTTDDASVNPTPLGRENNSRVRIHRETLASKEMSPGLSIVLTTVVTVVNYIKMRLLNSRIFYGLCKDMGAVHSSLLFYYEARWLSRGKFLQRVNEPRNEREENMLPSRGKPTGS
ncbi:SCAN domain-containing protein 3 [Trichonephila clavipes]|nr:SCAN domain-containing protein 3 [Trichonephila clavipes]